MRMARDRCQFHKRIHATTAKLIENCLTPVRAVKRVLCVCDCIAIKMLQAKNFVQFVKAQSEIVKSTSLFNH